MFEDSSLDDPTRDNRSLFSRNSEGNVTARLGSKMKLVSGRKKILGSKMKLVSEKKSWDPK